MDFRDLNYILAIAKHQNITKAAQSLYITQPSLSKFLINFENELGQKLFKKIGYKYQLTYAGEIFVEKAQQILNLKEELDDSLKELISEDIGEIHLAIPTMRSTYILPKLLPRYRDLHPNITVHITEGVSQEHEKLLLEGDVDLSICSVPKNKKTNLTYEPLWQEELIVAAARDFRLKDGTLLSDHAEKLPGYQYPAVDLLLLEQERMLLLQPAQRTRQLLDVYLNSHQIEFRDIMQLSNLVAILELLDKQYGITVLFDSLIPNSSYKDSLQCYSLKNDSFYREFCAVYRQDSYMPNSIRDIILLLQQLRNDGEI